MTDIVGFQRAAFEQRLVALHAQRTRLDAAIEETEWWLRVWDNQIAQKEAAAPPPADVTQEESGGSGTLPS